MRAWNRFYHTMYRINRTTRTARAWGSGSPRRVARLYERRAAYSIFARFINKLLS